MFDGLEHLEDFVGPLRFPRDYRIRELRVLLATASPVPINMDDTDGDAGDPEQGSQQQSKLWLMAARTSAMPIGRGAATLSTLLAKPTEALQVPTLCLAGCLPTQQFAVVNLDLAAPNAPAGFVNWPEFHNGAAAGLALRSDAKSGKLTRAWIVFNRPKVPTFSHAGVLMALGLNGHLSSLTATDLYRYLSQEHEATTVGTLLGVAASKLGTADPATSRMCFLHLPTRHPMSFPEIELPPLVQSSALLAVGLLYQGTAQRLIVETLLSELGKSPEGDVVSGRECYALSAGIALGLATLGRGHDSTGLSDLHVAERLRHFIAGGVARKIPQPGGVPTSMRKSASGAADWYDGVDDMTESSTASVDGYILEGSMINVDLSAPGAMMALGMMYMKSNDETVASYLDIPSTHYALDNARPDYVLLRVVARNVIMWDGIESHAQWIEGLLPPLLRGAMDVKAPEAREAQDDASWLGEADVEAIAQTYINVIAGGCMSIGLRYAGSGNVEAATTLRQYAFKFLEWKKKAGQGDQVFVSKSALEICIGVVAMSLACIMAGTGDLPTLRLLRHLRSRLDTSLSSNSSGLTYGAHMAIGLANGFLFLGGGSQTFSTDNASIAALMITMFPRFPSTTSDNRWHCQAYRHLYVLAARPRLLHTLDATTLEAVSTPLEMTCTVKGKDVTTQLITPCLLPDPSSLVRIRLISPRYWPLMLDFSSKARDSAKKELYALRRVPIQRHTSALSYEVDRTGAKAQLATALHAAGAKAALKPSSSDLFDQNTAPVANATAAQAGKDAVDVFTSDVTLLAFSRQMCDGSSDRAGFTAAALRECMEREVPDALRAYVDLYASCEALTHASSMSATLEEFASQGSLAVSDLRLLDAFNALVTRKSAITKEQSTNVSPVPELLSASFRQSVLLSLERAYGDGVLARYLRGHGYDASLDTQGAFGCYLRLLDMPNPKVLRQAIESGGASSASAIRARLPHLEPSTVLRVIESCYAS
jgi:anaphase-promoting complex subunit 1